MNAHAFPVRADEATVRTFLDIIHQQAARALEDFDQRGSLQLVCIDPSSGVTAWTRFEIGDVDGMVQAALAAADRGQNVYLEPRTIAEDVPATLRGDRDATCGVFALVVDRDGDKGQGGHLTADPSLVVETSPGNAHAWFFLERALTAAEAKPTGDAIRAASGADSNTGVLTQPYRVAGTPNFPSARKHARGRVVTPTRILATDGPRWTKDALIAAFPAPPPREGQSASSNGTGHDRRTVEALVAKIVPPATDRSARFQSAVNAAVRAGLAPEELEALMRQHPQGCAAKYLQGRDRLREEIERS